jgi:hypothetical protein
MRTVGTGGLLLCVSLLIASAVPSAAGESLQMRRRSAKPMYRTSTSRSNSPDIAR